MLQAEASHAEPPCEPQASPAAAVAGGSDDSSGSDGVGMAGGEYGGSEDDEEWQEVARYEMIEEQLRGSAKVAEVEQCLAEGGRERVRVQLLLQSSGGRNEELDIQARPASPAAACWCPCGLCSSGPTACATIGAALRPTRALAERLCPGAFEERGACLAGSPVPQALQPRGAIGRLWM